MSTAITGTVLSTVTLNSINAQFWSRSFCTDGTFGYWISASPFTQAGALWKCPIANWSNANVTQVYAAGFMGTDSTGCWASGGKIYSIEATGVSRIMSANADGSSGSATVEWSSVQFASGTPVSPHVDGSDVYVSSSTHRYLARLNLATDTIEQALPTVGFMCGVGPCRHESNSLLVGQANPGYIGIWKKDTGHIRCIAGSGTDSTISAGSAFAVAIDRIHFPSSDEDGRVYFLSNGRIWRLESGTVTQVGSDTGMTQMQHIFSLNRLIAGAGYEWRIYS